VCRPEWRAAGAGFGSTPLITVRKAEEIYRPEGRIENGTFSGSWHFSFGEYYDRRYVRLVALRVFNDDTLSPGAVWPVHLHREIEVATYCAAGEFRHADEHGQGTVLQKGWARHTTVGKGMFHSDKGNHGGYLYVVEGGGVFAGDEFLRYWDAAMIVREPELLLKAREDTELLFVVAGLK